MFTDSGDFATLSQNLVGVLSSLNAKLRTLQQAAQLAAGSAANSSSSGGGGSGGGFNITDSWLQVAQLAVIVQVKPDA